MDGDKPEVDWKYPKVKSQLLISSGVWTESEEAISVAAESAQTMKGYAWDRTKHIETGQG
jgi:hypothetical protein